MKKLFAVFAAGLLVISTSSGHHSEFGIDLDSVVSFEGAVTEFSWSNPHVYLGVETVDERGEPVEWLLQMGSIVTAARAGWARDSLAIGDRVSVRVNPAEDGRPYGMLESVDTESGPVSGSVGVRLEFYSGYFAGEGQLRGTPFDRGWQISSRGDWAS